MAGLVVLCCRPPPAVHILIFAHITLRQWQAVGLKLGLSAMLHSSYLCFHISLYKTVFYYAINNFQVYSLYI